VVDVEADPSETEVTKTMEIPLNQIALCIGKGGATRMLITEATGANIDFPKKGGVHTMTIISGPDIACVDAAMKALKQLVTKGYSEITHSGQIDDGINVPQKSMRAIVGTGGATINKLRQMTGTEINLPDRDSEDTFVSVMGQPADVQDAIKAIKELVEQGFSGLTHPNWTSKKVQVPRDQVGNIIGTGGSTIKRLEQETSSRINVPSTRDGDFITVTVSGDVADVPLCVIQIEALMVPEVPEEIPFEWTLENVQAMNMAF